MSMTTDTDHQALDLNIGRIVELYIKAEIPLAVARKDLTRFFGESHNPTVSSDLQAYLGGILAQMRAGDLEPAEVRADLVRLAALAFAQDPDFAAQIRPEDL